MRRRIRRLSSQILLAQVAILTASMVIGFVLFAQTARSNLDADYQARAAGIAQTFAGIPEIRSCMTSGGPDCATTVQALASQTARRTGADYVVVIDRDRVRHSHPDPSLIGQKVSEPLVARDGRVHLGVDSGATGVNANARVPLFGDGTDRRRRGLGRHPGEQRQQRTPGRAADVRGVVRASCSPSVRWPRSRWRVS